MELQTEQEIRFETIHNKLVYLLNKHPNLVESSNEEMIDAFRSEFDEQNGGRKTPSESITRAWRHLKSLGFYRPKDERMILAKDKLEQEYKQYYGRDAY